MIKPINPSGSNILKEAPENYEATATIAVIVNAVGAFRCIAQRWKHVFNSKEDVWVAAPTWIIDTL